ncbi:MAG: tetratricopeptide repeat protein, partial [Woeseiaceae bacterium]
MTIGEGHRNRPSRRLQKLIEAGVRALSEGDRPRAVECCETALAERPEMARAHYLAGLIATDSTDRGTAVQAFSRTVELNENHAGAWAQLARLRVSGGDFVKAEGCLKNAVNTFKGNTTVADLIGTAFRLAGNYDAALEWHKKAVAASSNHVPYLVNLANLHLYRGGLDDARGLLDRCLDLEPDNPLVHWLVSRCTRAQSEIHIEAMKLLLADVAEPRQAAYLHFATGKEYEDLEQWAPAFAAYDAGAVARRKSVAFDEEAQVELYDFLASNFTEAWLANQRSDRVDNSPVFVVGLPRTGSTLLDRMLDAHPAVNSA